MGFSISVNSSNGGREDLVTSIGFSV